MSKIPPTNYPNLGIHARCTEFPNMGKPHDDFRRLFEAPYNSTDLLGTAANSTNLLEVSNNYNSSSLTTITNLNATKAFFLEIPLVPIPSTLDSTAQDDCNDKTLAPNNTVCCDQESGLWVPAQVVRDGPLASMANPACPANTGGTGGVGAGSGIINTSDRGKVNANSGLL